MVLPAAKRMSFGDFLRGRTRRLVVPWLTWSAFYATLKLGEVVITETTLSAEFAPYMILTGPALHLWFLPFAFVVSLLAYPLVQLARFDSLFLLPVLLTTIALFFLLIQQDRTFPIPLIQWLYGAPSICLGLALALAGLHFWISVLILCAFTGAALLTGAQAGLEQIIIATAAFILSTAWRLPQTPLSAWASKTALGVYLAHPLVLSILARTTSLDPEGSSTAILACLGALGIALFLIWTSGHRKPTEYCPE